ncbi:UNVERIFIED_CONTAM: hypothetical protein K2H54_059344, partial [Gekko kuhli]
FSFPEPGLISQLEKGKEEWLPSAQVLQEGQRNASSGNGSAYGVVSMKQEVNLQPGSLNRAKQRDRAQEAVSLKPEACGRILELRKEQEKQLQETRDMLAGSRRVQSVKKTGVTLYQRSPKDLPHREFQTKMA